LLNQNSVLSFLLINFIGIDIEMVKTQHLKVLLMKDWLTLKRNKGFIVSFIVVPIAFCGLFCWLQSLALDGTRVGSLIENPETKKPSGNMWFTSNEPATPLNLQIPTAPNWLTVLLNLNSESITFANATTVATHCGKVLTGGGGDYTKIGIVATDKTVRDNAKTFFTDYFLTENSLPDAAKYPTNSSRTVTFDSKWPKPFSVPPFLG